MSSTASAASIHPLHSDWGTGEPFALFGICTPDPASPASMETLFSASDSRVSANPSSDPFNHYRNGLVSQLPKFTEVLWMCTRDLESSLPLMEKE